MTRSQKPAFLCRSKSKLLGHPPKNPFKAKGSMLEKMCKGTRKSRNMTGPKPEAKLRDMGTMLASLPGPQARETRRQSVLNVQFMRYITDIMTTASFSQNLVGCGIKLLGVHMSKGCSNLNVRWAGTGTAKDTEIQAILDKHKQQIRDELMYLHFMGIPPKINFVRDLSHAKYSAIEDLLQKADYGPEEEHPTDPPLKQTDDLIEKSFGPSNIPEMKTDVAGLDHPEMMTKVLSNIRKARARLDKIKIEEVSSDSPPQLVSYHDTKSSIQQYLKDRRKRIAHARKSFQKETMEVHKKAVQVMYNNESDFEQNEDEDDDYEE